ncbi:MAG: TerB family tellurite resistance protein [Gammaproteobacteria bacterium]|nr:TerB family tellurite resistance protein [Gammaproteobacteria bacterium]MDP2141128.1 TerB family tellurite resistance protein [Gammaproteobacteria bacterium]MDP2349197.1 TerB family tellurite resistance protein [Gammaproteobacteria bacterium]
MILAIKRFFEDNLQVNGNDSEQSTDHRIELATAALLFELVKADLQIDQRETDALAAVLKQTFKLDGEELAHVIALAEEESHQSTSLYEFTSLVNAGYSYEQRVKLLENLWRVAFADASVDRYEEHLVRKIADLIYVNHSDFIRSKLKVRDALSTLLE